MEFGVLGPLYVRVDGETTAPSAPKLRNVLAMLLVHTGQVVPVPSLVRDLWDDDPPVSGLTTLQTYILNLRKMFSAVTGLTTDEVARDILVTRAGGYVLAAEAGALDLHRYRRLVTSGREALVRGDDAAGVRDLNEALLMWRGPALVDVPAGRVLESRRRQLEESRLAAFEYLVDVELRLGMYREVLAELAALTVENPLHEGLHGQYMWALHLSGRRAQALQVFHRLRGALVAGLGLEPGPQVQRLHRAVLNADTDFEPRFAVGRAPVAVAASAFGGARPY
ncbi:BTAD domain-containing putative transcriptional regulator [Streptomyces sp. NPDC020707]|jgi:DNA-binding SARP family transcriptional activator|uniref:AfsR/SARP family transcriptional regulator n=1 Tax=Streptomyces ortus TaxID=2867268 RepID=A0ABT3VA49_9ACTN|nr:MULTISPECIES: AfsR/SARP family transcriptional regulator [Streptomyces]MCX4236621.1 AfsR/SARP family transcriptional regulator [Streptomyces ortus]